MSNTGCFVNGNFYMEKTGFKNQQKTLIFTFLLMFKRIARFFTVIAISQCNTKLLNYKIKNGCFDISQNIRFHDYLSKLILSEQSISLKRRVKASRNHSMIYKQAPVRHLTRPVILHRTRTAEASTFPLRWRVRLLRL